LDTEWLLSTLFDASLLPLQKPPETAALFLPYRHGALFGRETGRWPAGYRTTAARGNHKRSLWLDSRPEPRNDLFIINRR
jgi:hypothetical protein